MAASDVYKRQELTKHKADVDRGLVMRLEAAERREIENIKAKRTDKGTSEP